MIAANVQSAQSEERLSNVIRGFEQVKWHIALVSETWRPEKEEIWEADDEGYTFWGSGGSKGFKGVAIIIQKSCKFELIGFSAINSRLCFADIKVRRQCFRFIAAYFPHTGLSEIERLNMYNLLSEIESEAEKNGYKVIIGGDFNAEVGSRKDDDDDDDENENVIGKYGTHDRNDAGEQ